MSPLSRSEELAALIEGAFRSLAHANERCPLDIYVGDHVKTYFHEPGQHSSSRTGLRTLWKTTRCRR